MENVNLNAALWKPARLSMQGAYNGIKLDIPQVGNPKQLLEFLHYHMSPQQRADEGYWPIHYVFSALALASNEETHRGLATYDFSDPRFIDTTIEMLKKPEAPENKDSKVFRKSTIFVLAELDKYLFTTEKVFADPKKASDFVLAWSTGIREFLGDPTHQVEKVVVKVLLAIAHLPCLRVSLPKERWNLIQHFPYVMNTSSPPLRRCLEDATIIPFLKETMGTWSQPPWLGMLWVMYHRLSKEVRKQLEKETQGIATGQGFFHLDPYLSLLETSLENLQTRINGLDPLDRAASDLWVRRESMAQAKERLLSIRERAEKKFLSESNFYWTAHATSSTVP